MENLEKVAEKVVKDLLELLGFPETTFHISRNEESQITIDIECSPEDAGILIGFHGETLASLQLIIGQALYKKIGEWNPILVNIGDYRQKRQEALQSMARGMAERVRTTGQAVAIPNLTSNERRLIHLFLSEDPEITTSSEGEGRDRRLIIRRKDEQKPGDSQQ